MSRSPRKDQGYISPRKLLDQGPDVTPTEPAYDRYKHLLAAGKESLPLPPKYAHLEKILDRLDCVLKLMNQRGEVATFERIRDRMDRSVHSVCNICLSDLNLNDEINMNYF